MTDVETGFVANISGWHPYWTFNWSIFTLSMPNKCKRDRWHLHLRQFNKIYWGKKVHKILQTSFPPHFINSYDVTCIKFHTHFKPWQNNSHISNRMLESLQLFTKKKKRFLTSYTIYFKTTCTFKSWMKFQQYSDYTQRWQLIDIWRKKKKRGIQIDYICTYYIHLQLFCNV